MQDRSAGLAALADPIRRRLLDQLSDKGPQSASTLADAFDISRQAIVKHLAQLERAGLVTRAIDGRAVLFSIDRQELSDTAMWLTATAQRWNERLDRLGALVDGD